MRKFLLSALLCAAAFVSNAQTITFKNTSNCTLYATLLADFGCTPTGPGGTYYQSQLVAIPAGAITSFNINTFSLWSGAAPTLTGENWLAVKLVGSLMCSSNLIYVGRGACSGWGTISMMPMDQSCNNCSQITAEWTNNGTNYNVKIQ